MPHIRNRVVFRISLAGAVLMSVAPAAEAARRYGLAGNVLIEDADDVFMYPQLATKYARSVGFDYGVGKSSGSATLLMGDNYRAWGVALHRGDAMTPWKSSPDGDLNLMGGYGSGFGAASPAVQDPAIPAVGGGGGGAENLGGDPTAGDPANGAEATADPAVDAAANGQTAAGLGATPKTLIDLFYASADPGKSGWGLRFTLGTDKTFNDPKASGAGENADAEHFAAVTFGYGDHENAFEYDGAATLLIDMGSSTTNGKETMSSTRFDLTVNARGSMPLAGEKDTRLGLLAQARYGTTTIEPKGAGKNAADDVRLLAGAGPVVKVAERITVAGYATLGVTRQTHDPDSKAPGDLDGRLAFLFPGFNIATEIKLTEWMQFRSGAEYTYTWQTQDVGKAPGGTVNSNRADSFVWNTGLGFKFGDLVLDGALSHQFLTEGPDFIGGDSPLFAMVSANAKF
jgi:hypothetical protein